MNVKPWNVMKNKVTFYSLILSTIFDIILYYKFKLHYLCIYRYIHTYIYTVHFTHYSEILSFL